MTNFVGRLGVTLGLDSAEFSRGIEGASKKLEQLAASAKTYAAVAATAFTASAAAALRYADELADVSKANDVAISSVIQLRDALAKSGGEAGNASKLLASFTQYIDKAAEGSFEAQKMLKGLGISVGDLKTLSMDELFRKTAAGLAEMEDSLTRNAKGMEVFGKAGKSVDFVGFNEELSKTTKITKDHEDGIKAAADAYDNLAEISRRALERMAAFVGPTLKRITEEIKNNEKRVVQALPFAGATPVLLEALAQATDRLARYERTKSEADLSAQDVEAMANMGGGIVKPPARRAVKDAVNKDEQARLKKELDDYLRIYNLKVKAKEAFDKETGEAFDELKKGDEEELKRRQQINKVIAEGIQAGEDEREAARRAQFELDDSRQKAELDLKDRQAQEMKGIDRQKIMLDLTDKGLLMKAREYQFAQEILQAQFRYEDAAKQIRDNDALTSEAKIAAMARLKTLTEAEFDLAKQRLALAEKMQNATFAEGFFTAMIQSAQNATSAFDYGRQAFDSMMGSMSNALTQFVRTGKLSFKDLARSIISDLIAIQLRAQATALFSRMISGMMTGPTVGPGMAAEALPAGFNQFLAARAEGGPVSGGSPYLVGERGPELFVPNRSGAIVPTNQLAGVMGGGQTINYNGPFIQQMSAIDTQSGIQFLAQNKQAVWAANQSAQRSLPVSR